MGLRIPSIRTFKTFRVAIVLAAAALVAFATPAGAVIVEVKEGAETVDIGVHTRKLVGAPETPLQYHGGPVDPQSFTYAIYWDPREEYHSDWLRLIDGYLHEVGAASGQLENVFALSGQYTEPPSSRTRYKSTFRGAYTDTFPYPSNGCSNPKGQVICLTDAQIRTELKRFIENEHLPKGREIIYYVLTPPAVTVCLESGSTENCSTSSKELAEEAHTSEEPANKPEPEAVETATGFCSYHGAIEPASSSPIIYAVQPWTAGHAGHVNQAVPLVTMAPTAAELACQNRAKLVEPNQETTFSHFDSYETGLADLIINDMSIEQSSVVPDPVFDAWYQEGTRAEQGDMCQSVFNPVKEESQTEEKLKGTQALLLPNNKFDEHEYYLQYEYSSVGVTAHQTSVCWSGVELLPHFTVTNVVGKTDDVAFDGLETSMTLIANPSELKLDEPYTLPLYKWEFGDGAAAGPSTQASIIHSYTAAGEYNVTLTVTDSGGNVRSYSHIIPVGGPPSPGTSPTPPGGGGPPTVGNPPAPTSVNSAPSAGPTLTESVLSSSLSKVVRLGLPIKYKVNEQVAGRAEALLEKTTASRLGIKGPLAAGLPKGYPREVVVGTAVLVTTRAGQGTVRIKFSKTVAKHLAKAHQVKLTLRFVLRNASSGGVHTTTTLSTVILRH
ncbi:MAG TPA: PKD domain-containing protein [Solirubrobacteraceae bacterium]|nr:PKD domain-containing protein [Solirubrobacteraceae bacterium]